MGILVWLGGAAVAFTAARLLDFVRVHAIAELLVAFCGALTAGAVATLLDFGGWGEPDLRAFLFAALVSSLSIALTRLTVVALRWPEYRKAKDPKLSA